MSYPPRPKLSEQLRCRAALSSFILVGLYVACTEGKSDPPVGPSGTPPTKAVAPPRPESPTPESDFRMWRDVSYTERCVVRLGPPRFGVAPHRFWRVPIASLQILSNILDNTDIDQ